MLTRPSPTGPLGHFPDWAHQLAHAIGKPWTVSSPRSSQPDAAHSEPGVDPLLGTRLLRWTLTVVWWVLSSLCGAEHACDLRARASEVAAGRISGGPGTGQKHSEIEPVNSPHHLGIVTGTVDEGVEQLQTPRTHRFPTSWRFQGRGEVQRTTIPPRPLPEAGWARSERVRAAPPTHISRRGAPPNQM
jgi:hypothetical protein